MLIKPFRLLVAQLMCRHLPPLFSQRIREYLYPRNLALKDDYEFSVQAQTGSVLKSRTSDFHGYPFAIHGYYDWRRWAIVSAVCEPGDSIIEVGANIGTETVGFSDLVGPTGRVYAYEPFPANVVILQENARSARHQNIDVHPTAVGDRCGFVRFAPPEQREYSGIGQVMWQSDQCNGTIEVECLTLDSCLKNFPPIKALFVDAEGAETKILSGARELIKRDAPVIVIEASEATLKSSGASLEMLWAEISEFDYEIYEIDRLGLLALTSFTRSRSEGNWFCVQRKQRSLCKRVSSRILLCGILPFIPYLNPLTRAGR